MATLISRTGAISVDEILPYIGEFGRFQWLLEALFCVMVLIMYFAALNSPWICKTNSTLCLMNGTLSSENKARCSMPRSEWKYTESSDYSIVTQFDIDCENEWLKHLTTSIYFVGWGVGAVVLGWIADSYGRKRVLFSATALQMLAGFLSAFVPNIYWLIVLRFIGGFFKPATSLQALIIMTELVSSKYRPRVASLMYFVFGIALCLTGLKAYFIRTWKLLFIVCSAPYLVVLLSYNFVPESVRWLRLHGKTNEAMNILQRIAKFNKKEIPADVTVTPGPSYVAANKPSILDLFRPRKIFIWSVVQGYTWMVTAMVYYGISFAADDLGGDLYRNYILMTMVEFPAHCCSFYFCKKIGRKKTTMIPMALAGITCIVVAFMPSKGDANIARIICALFGKFCVSICFDCIYTWSLEIYPTTIRAEGMGYLQVTSRIGSASAPWVAKSLITFHNAAPFIFMGITTLIASAILIVLPETKGAATAETCEEVVDQLLISTEEHELKQT